MKLFLDTNVLIDFLLERPPFYPAAAMIMSYAFEDKVGICVSSMSVVTTHYICVDRCKMPIEAFRRKMDFLRGFMEVCAVESTDVFKSYDANWKDFEDGVQYHVAIRNGADYLVTRNTKDFEENEIEVISLDWACKLLQKGE